MTETAEQTIRNQLLELLAGGGAHAAFDDIVPSTPAELRGHKPEALPHSPWMLLEHMRIAQWDILEFSRSSNHVSPEWPKGYWPASERPPDDASWENSIRQFRNDNHAMKEMVTNPRMDLFSSIPWGDGQTIFREALLVADHNAYHLGQFVDLRRLLGCWPK